MKRDLSGIVTSYRCEGKRKNDSSKRELIKPNQKHGTNHGLAKEYTKSESEWQWVGVRGLQEEESNGYLGLTNEKH